MAAIERKLMVFAHLGPGWAPCGQLLMTEDGPDVLASSFAYGLNYLRRPDAQEVDPVSLGLLDRAHMAGKRLLPAHGLPHFGGIRDTAPDAWGRRVIEAKLKVPANSLPESQYLLHAGSDRVGALDIRGSINDGPTQGTSVLHALEHLMEAAERIEEGLPVPAHLEAIFMDGTALGGARPKASVRDEQGVLWLAKFSSRMDSFDIPAIECAPAQPRVRLGAGPGRLALEPALRRAAACKPRFGALPAPGRRPARAPGHARQRPGGACDVHVVARQGLRDDCRPLARCARVACVLREFRGPGG